MNKVNKSYSDDIIDDLLVDYHSHIKHQFDSLIDADLTEAMQQNILAMAEEQAEKDKSHISKKLSNNSYQSKNFGLSPSYLAKAASWALFGCCTLFIAAITVSKQVDKNSQYSAKKDANITTPFTVAESDIPVNSANNDYANNNYHLNQTNKSVPENMIAQQHTVNIHKSTIKEDMPNSNSTNSKAANETVDITLEDVLGGEITMARLEPAAPNEQTLPQNSPDNSPEDFQHAEHSPSIRITIEQAPVLPAGSTSDPEQIAIENSI